VLIYKFGLQCNSENGGVVLRDDDCVYLEELRYSNLEIGSQIEDLISDLQLVC